MKLVLIAFLIAILNQEVSHGQLFGPSKFSIQSMWYKMFKGNFCKEYKKLAIQKGFSIYPFFHKTYDLNLKKPDSLQFFLSVMYESK